jgi:dihydroneopterin aldolase
VENPASDSVHVEQLEVFARVGVTENERKNPQGLALSIDVWPKVAFEDLQDDITSAVDYSAVSAAARDFVHAGTPNLIETLAAQLASHLLRTFPARKVQIELRKFVLPDAKYVSVSVTRSAVTD